MGLGRAAVVGQPAELGVLADDVGGLLVGDRAAGGVPDQVVALRVECTAAVGSGNRAGVSGQDRPLQVHGVSSLRKGAAAIRGGVGGDRRAENIDGRFGEPDYVDGAPVGGGAVSRDGAVDHVQDGPGLGVDPATLAHHTGCDVACHRSVDDGQRHVADHVETAPGSRAVAGDRRAGDRRASAGAVCFDATARSAVCPTGDGQPVEGGSRRRQAPRKRDRCRRRPPCCHRDSRRSSARRDR